MTVRNITAMTAYIMILVMADYILTPIPGFQVIMLLIFVMAKSFKSIEAFLIVLVYVLIDNFLYGGIGIYTIPMVIGWLIIVFILKAFKEKNIKGHIMALISIPMSFVYTLPFMIFNVLIYDIKIIPYIIADFPFTLGIILSSYLTIDLFYDRIITVMKNII